MIKCKIEPDFGITVTASKKRRKSDSDHPLTRAIRDALVYLASA